MAACAAPVQVTEVGSGSGAPAFDLTGDSLAGLMAVADKACPHGHTVLRRWQGGQMTDPQANYADKAWFQAQRLVGETTTRAQLVVQCLPATPVPAVVGEPPPTAP